MTLLPEIHFALHKLGSEQAAILENLGVEGASTLTAFDIARVGAATLSPDEVEYQIRPTGVTDELTRALLGETLSTGLVAQTIRNASRQPDTDAFETLQANLARMLAYAFVFDATIIPHPGVRVDYGQGLLDLDTDLLLLLAYLPARVVEYGPGLASAHKMSHEYHIAQQTIAIENNPYVNQFLVTLATLYGFNPGQSAKFIGRHDGIKSTTDILLTQSKAAGMFDMVIASQIQSATAEELIAGIENAYALLSAGGLFVFRGSDHGAASPYSSYQMDVNECQAKSKEVFGAEPIFEAQISTRNIKQDNRGTGKVFVMVK